MVVSELKKNNIIVTIDGPTASGKSSVARIVAKELGIFHLNTGLLYRSVGYLLVTNYGYNKKMLEHPNKKDVKAVTDPKHLAYTYDSTAGVRVLFNGDNITRSLKDGAVDAYASVVAKNKLVRSELLGYQRYLAEKSSIVAEGRDMGSAVFNNAQCKFYLTASLKVRAERWRLSQQSRGNIFSQAEAECIVNERDERDRNRTLDPLVVPKDAYVIDTDDKTINQVVAIIIQKIKERAGH